MGRDGIGKGVGCTEAAAAGPEVELVAEAADRTGAGEPIAVPAPPVQDPNASPRTAKIPSARFLMISPLSVS
ncbi:MAG: hypothetical protein JO247_09325 [Chloroflexi bacterium]|nr:hypothetical protein [Chloroflexota bacterium]